MIDMHCHILPGIDDGAKTVDDSMALLREEKNQGIKKIVFTPHFNPERQNFDHFLAAREDSYRRLRSAEGFEELKMETKLDSLFGDVAQKNSEMNNTAAENKSTACL